MLDLPHWNRTARSPFVIAHRGASLAAPENTLEAFRLAKEHGAHGIELDVQGCKGGDVVVFHDDDLGRLTGQPGLVKDAELRELRALSVSGHAIPTLDEALETIDRGLLVNIELKTRAGLGAVKLDDFAKRVAGIVRRHALGRRALVSSFNPFLLFDFRAFAPEIPTGLLYHGKQSYPLRQALLRGLLCPMALHPEHRLCEAERVEKWRKRGFVIHAWTCDDAKRARALARLKIDAIITNDPRSVRAALHECP